MEPTASRRHPAPATVPPPDAGCPVGQLAQRPRAGTIAPVPTVADHFVATLKASGVQRIYGIPGDSLNGFTDALRRDGGIDWIHVRHEEAAGFAAAGEAATTG